MKTTFQKSIEAGINLVGTVHDGQSAKQLRRSNPRLARKWAGFIKANKAQLVREISGALCKSS